MPPIAAAAMATTFWKFTHIMARTMLVKNPKFIATVCASAGVLPDVLSARKSLPRRWWGRMIVLATLNTAVFLGLLFVVALRLPGGVSATLQALGPLFMNLSAWPMLGMIPSLQKIGAVACCASGISLIVLQIKALKPLV